MAFNPRSHDSNSQFSCFTQNDDLKALWQQLKADYRIAEADILKRGEVLIDQYDFNEKQIEQDAIALASKLRLEKTQPLSVEGIMNMHRLDSDEGLSLMTMAEALLRIPDADTQTKLIHDKLKKGQWGRTGGNDTLSRIANWGLGFSEKLLGSGLRKYSSGVIRTTYARAMKMMGYQFVLGESIDDAITRGKKSEKCGFTHSFDMLGEAARTMEDAKAYFDAYDEAIERIGQHAREHFSHAAMHERPSISVKLSALHPRYEPLHYETIMQDLFESILQLCQKAKAQNIALTIDAEEADRLYLSLEIIHKLLNHETLQGWHGLGVAVQAYQKRALSTLQLIAKMAKLSKQKVAIRLVKGAYWDTEIKAAQVNGLSDFPVFTYKHHTDVNYFAAAILMFQNAEYVNIQFASHNAHTLCFLNQLSKKYQNTDFEIQRLHGMGQALFGLIYNQSPKLRQRIYAPVGLYKDLLAYLVRRLLENGANSSFVNKIHDENVALTSLVMSPLVQLKQSEGRLNPRIALPSTIFPDRKNSDGEDISDPDVFVRFQKALEAFDLDQIVFHTQSPEEMAACVVVADQAKMNWHKLGVNARVQMIRKLADLMQDDMEALCAILMKEANKTLLDAIGEVREAIDFCRYYANQALHLQEKEINLPGPVGEQNLLAYEPRGVVLSIAPWNFPLAIFLGQVVGPLSVGNVVLAKCASQTKCIAKYIHQLSLKAGIPADVFHLILGPREAVEAAIIRDQRIKVIAFTGSTGAAQNISKTIAESHQELIPFVAETGGINAMIVDSSALPEQVVRDVMISAFQSAGQRCSALRLLILQDEIADDVLKMLSGAMASLEIGEATDFKTDVGPVIDQAAFDKLSAYIRDLKQRSENDQAKEIYTCKYDGDVENIISPQAWKIPKVLDLPEEIFGPILHVVRYKSSALAQVIKDINALKYGLTLGVHSRIDETIDFVKSNAHVGNIYVNRNMIGAIVGSQPFGGMGLSGTGFKAGGPNYLLKFVHEKTISIDTTAAGGNASLLAEV